MMKNVLQSNCKGMKRMKFILLMACLLCLARTNAQTGVNLRLGSNSLAALPVFVHRGDVDSLTITIYNDSSTTFYGNITIGALVDTTTVVADTSSASPFCYPNAPILDSIPGHDSINRLLIITIKTPPFIIGSSAVVIWPIVSNSSNQLHITDSVSKTIIVFYPLGINEPDDKNLKVYMSGQQLIVQENDQYLLKNVKLYDVSGALLYQQQISISGEISMASFAPGIYLAEVKYADNTCRLFKIFNPR
jgi:hypothetical protein